MGNERILVGDCIEQMRTLPTGSIQTCITSPPYFGLRDYGVDGQIGLEQTPAEYVAKLVEVFREVRRVLADDGTLWLNLGDSYGKGKSLLGIPWRVAFALQADGWYLRQDIIWHKPNPMPESVRDRCTKAHEYLFLLSKSPRYYFDADAIKEPLAAPHNLTRTSVNGQGNGELGAGKRFGSPDPSGRNKRSVWTVTPKPFKGAHFATFPPDLIEPCVLAGSRPGDTVLDPFGGSGTTGMVARKHGRDFVLCELNPDYAAMANHRIWGEAA